MSLAPHGRRLVVWAERGESAELEVGRRGPDQAAERQSAQASADWDSGTDAGKLMGQEVVVELRVVGDQDAAAEQ